jgi:hypothetical protein
MQGMCSSMHPHFVVSHHGIVLCLIGGPFNSTWCICSPSPVSSYNTILYSCLPLPKALLASSSPAWLKKPQPWNLRHWAIQWGAKVGVGFKRGAQKSTCPCASRCLMPPLCHRDVVRCVCGFNEFDELGCRGRWDMEDDNNDWDLQSATSVIILALLWALLSLGRV